MAIPKAKTNNTAANLGFEAKLWLAADKLRNNTGRKATPPRAVWRL